MTLLGAPCAADVPAMKGILDARENAVSRMTEYAAALLYPQ